MRLLTEVVWDSPAFKVGLTTNTSLVAVNGRTYSADLLKRAIADAATGGPAGGTDREAQDQFRTVTLDYRGGLRYPHFEPIAGRPDGIAALLAPRAADAAR